jgi:hypothetical protein
VFGRHRANVWHQNVQVAVHKTVEVDVDLDTDLERRHRDFKQTVSVRSQAEMELFTAEAQMKKDLQI